MGYGRNKLRKYALMHIYIFRDWDKNIVSIKRDESNLTFQFHTWKIIKYDTALSYYNSWKCKQIVRNDLFGQFNRIFAWGKLFCLQMVGRVQFRVTGKVKSLAKFVPWSLNNLYGDDGRIKMIYRINKIRRFLWYVFKI